jgi:hypothetical protein
MLPKSLAPLRALVFVSTILIPFSLACLRSYDYGELNMAAWREGRPVIEEF